MINKETVTLKMFEKLKSAAGVHTEILDEVCRHYRIEYIWQLPIVEYYAALSFIDWRKSLKPKEFRKPFIYNQGE